MPWPASAGPAASPWPAPVRAWRCKSATAAPPRRARSAASHSTPPFGPAAAVARRPASSCPPTLRTRHPRHARTRGHDLKTGRSGFQKFLLCSCRSVVGLFENGRDLVQSRAQRLTPRHSVRHNWALANTDATAPSSASRKVAKLGISLSLSASKAPSIHSANASAPWCSPSSLSSCRLSERGDFSLADSSSSAAQLASPWRARHNSHDSEIGFGSMGTPRT